MNGTVRDHGQDVVMLELNEVNFDMVHRYVRQGHLPNFGAWMHRHGVSRTTSETRYEDLEPWIQWVTAHTGLGLDQHKVFRLGDIVGTRYRQIWEHVAQRTGRPVGAVSPMNARNELGGSGGFFIPDPWTDTPASGSALVRALAAAVAQVVNDNAKARLTLRSALTLSAGVARFARPSNWSRYGAYALGSRRRPWRRALFLDLLLTDIFVALCRSERPVFASLFLNAAAHIQHHYMFASGAYSGPMRNPEWYLESGMDPLLEVYELYDRVLGQVRAALPRARILLATGLHQDPHDQVVYYWRLRDHAGFLERFGVRPARVQPRMSRDFLATFHSTAAAAEAEARILGIVERGGRRLFAVDNRGADLFVELTFDGPIDARFVASDGRSSIDDLAAHVAFVAIKNGRHNSVGYYSDSSCAAAQAPEVFPLAEIPDRVCAALGIPALVPSADDRRPGQAA